MHANSFMLTLSCLALAACGSLVESSADDINQPATWRLSFRVIGGVDWSKNLEYSANMCAPPPETIEVSLPQKGSFDCPKDCTCSADRASDFSEPYGETQDGKLWRAEIQLSVACGHGQGIALRCGVIFDSNDAGSGSCVSSGPPTMGTGRFCDYQAQLERVKSK